MNNKNKITLQRASLRKSLSRSEDISPEVVTDLREFRRGVSVRTYKKRWLILLLFVLFDLGTKVQWLQYIVILNVVVKFFNVSPIAVKATAIIYSVLSIILLYPVIWLIHKRGVRFVVVIAAASTCLGTWIKYFGIYPDQFSLILVGQCFVGACQVVTASLPATLAAHWFGPNEVATATALGISGTVFGVVFSCIIGPIIVRSHEGAGDIGKDLNHYVLPLGYYCSCTLFLLFFFFSEKPRLSPSKSRALQTLCITEDLDFFKKIYRLLKNRDYVILWNAHGFITGAMICVNVSLNTLYMRHFKNGEQDIRKLVILFILSGYCGSIVFAKILDRFKIFKIILIILYVANILATILLVVSMYFEMRWAVFVSIGIWGFFTLAYYTTSFETCAEISYPEPVTICISFLNLANQLYSVIFVVCLDQLLIAYSDVAAYALLVTISVIGCILTCVTRDERRRQSAGKIRSQSESNVNVFEIK